MKRILIVFLITALAVSCSDDPSKKVKPENLQKAKEQMSKMDKFPEMKFEYTEVDFGKHKEGEILDTVFVFTNVGEAPLIISKVKTSCGCTASDWPRQPVQPGETGKIAVSFNTNHKTGNQVKTITIHSNEKQLTRTLKIKAQVEPKNPAQKKTASKTSNPKIKDFKKIQLPEKNKLLLEGEK